MDQTLTRCRDVKSGRAGAWRARAWLACLVGLTAGGCAFGPKELERTHGPYTEAVRLVYEEQFLRNIVHRRYSEPVSAVDIQTIAAQFELTCQAEARPFFVAPNPSDHPFRTFTSILPDMLARKSDRPTISMSPIDEGDWMRRFLTPIPADTLMFLADASRSASALLRLWVERLNGVPNAVAAGGPERCGVPDFARFQRVAELAQVAQDRELILLHPEERVVELSGPLPADCVTALAAVEAAAKGLEYRPRPDGKTWVLVRKERRLVLQVTPGACDSPEVAELVTLLNLTPGLPRYDLVVVSGGVPDPLLYPWPPSPELRIVTRSTSQVFSFLANGVEVPGEHLDCGLVKPAVDEEGKVFDARAVTAGLFEVHVAPGHKPPKSAYVAVKYRGHWFYIDDADAASKETLSLMIQLVRLDFNRQRLGGTSGPLLTLPVGR
jgi:hypothetical protein